MLDLMRKKAGSWIIKIILGAIILSFAFFFGFSQLSSPFMGSEPLAARVGDEGVTQKSYSVALNRSMEQMKQNFKDMEMNEKLISIIQNNILSQLIHNKVQLLFAQSLGLEAPPEIIAMEIKKNPTLNKDGLFDLNFYQKQFRPYFQRQYGIDYEKILEEELILNQFQDILVNSLFVSPLESKWLKEKPSYDIILEKIEIPPMSLANFIDFSPEEVTRYIEEHKEELQNNQGVSIEVLATQRLQNEKANEFAKKIAKDLQKKWRQGKLSKAFLKKYDLKKERLDKINPQTANRIFFREVPHNLKVKIFSLSSENRYLEEPAFMNGNYYVLKFIDKETSGQQDSAVEGRVTPHFSDYYSQWLNTYRDGLTIENYTNR